MRIAYILTAYQRPAQLVRLIKRLNSPTATFFIHVDRKTDGRTFAQMVEPLKSFAHVFFLERHACYWGDFSQVRASLAGIRELMERRTPFDYAMLLTGQDYPLKSNACLEDFLEKSGGDSYLSYYPMPLASWAGHGGMDRINHWHAQWLQRIWVLLTLRNPFRAGNLRSPAKGIFLPPRSWPFPMRLFGGEAHWCLSKKCIEYIHDFLRRDTAYLRFFKHVGIPDEIFYQTLLLNSPLAPSLKNTRIHYINWNGNPAPVILRCTDFETLLQSPCLFARKFDTTVDAEIMDQLDRVLDAAPDRQVIGLNGA